MLLNFLKEIPDCRDREGRRYDLAHILLFTILAILSNAKNYKDVSRFISVHFQELKEIYGLKWRKVPNYTTVRNILIGVRHEEFEGILYCRWSQGYKRDGDRSCGYSSESCRAASCIESRPRNVCGITVRSSAMLPAGKR